MVRHRQRQINIVELRIEDCYRDGEFAELAFQFAPVGLVVTENRVIRDYNQAFADMFGYDVIELKNSLFSVLYPTEKEFINVRDRGVKKLQETNTYCDERVMAQKEGTLFWCRARGHSFTPENPLNRAVWSFADLSESRPYVTLTRREREIISFLVEGMTSKEIARKLELSFRTVEVYRAKLIKKFGVSNTSALFQALGELGGSDVVTRSGH